MDRHIVILVTTSSKKEAEKIAKALLKEKLAACVNIISGIKSFFHWEGKIDNADELLLLIKTRKKLFKKVERTVKQCHSYTAPEVIALPIVEGSKKYLDWIDNVTVSK